MYLWRNLPDGQFLTVLRWLKDRGVTRRGAAVTEAAEAAPLTSGDLAAEEAPPATR